MRVRSEGDMDNYIKEFARLFGKALVEYTDFNIWYLSLEEHHKAGIRTVARAMLREMKPWYIPRWLWARWIKDDG